MRHCEKCGRRFAGEERVCPDDGTALSDPIMFEEQAVGKTLDDKYRIDGFLKRGGMGAVYRGTHLMLGKPVAIKLIKPELVSSADVVQRFLREARAAAHLNHPNIVTVHDLGQTTDGTLYIAMELVDGKSLKELIVSEGAWEPKRAMRLLRGIGSALAVAHRNGVVHRDLKPQNIMVSLDNDGDEIPKLLDFGIAKTFEPTSPALTSTGMVLGTPHYMSAEQAKGLPADRRSDLYALGVILYEMLVGKVPFDDTSIPQILIKHLSEPPKPPSAMGASIPKELEAIVLRCLEKEPDSRYQSAEELIGAIDSVPDTAAHDASIPTIAEVPDVPAIPVVPAVVPDVPSSDEPTRATRETTMAGAAAAAAPPPLPLIASTQPAASSSSGTVRAHQLRKAEKSGASRYVILGFIVVAVALVAWLLLRGQGGSGPESIEAAAAPVVPPVDGNDAGAVPAESGVESDSDPPATEIAEPANLASTDSREPSNSVPEAAPPVAGAQSVERASPPRVEPERSQRAVEAAPTTAPPPPLPEVPVLGFACEGVRDGCAALRFAIVEECRSRNVTVARPPRGDVMVRFGIEEIEARQQQQFGTTFVVRTYSVEGLGDSPHFDEELYLEPQLISFDARLGREKLREQTRLIASDVVAAVRDYWTRNRGR